MAVFAVDLTMFFFILPRGLAFPLSGDFLFCHAREIFVTWGFVDPLLLVTVTGCKTVTELSVVVVTMA